ncbi:hypothetical protein CMI42_03150 [Candidatus Pacearchaeota archaeon]|nr:hypothetical protein [Candidatus Pacearchaeota archaeon]|tara:strand:+ start:463 stop:1083 length:621 start_codon:yes stop_codon:yes gene_type:complete
MVTEEILIRRKWRRLKKTSKFLIIILVIASIFALTYYIGYSTKKPPIINQQKVIIENPLKDLVFQSTNNEGEVNKEQVIEQAILDFDLDYINYILIALGVNNLYKSKIGFGNPRVEFKIDDEIWSSEIINNNLNTRKSSIDDPDVRFHMSKEEIIESLLSSNLNQFVINSVSSGRTQIELIAGKPELLSKGYLKMYSDLTGNNSEI